MATTHELERPEPARSSDREILVVDDEGLIRGLLLRFLPTIGFAVTVAGNGKEGLDLFVEKSFALVLTDLRMPEMDGCTLSRHIKDTSPGTPVVVMTSYNSEDVAEAVKQSCIDTVLFKPFTLDDVSKTIQEAMGKGMLESATGIS